MREAARYDREQEFGAARRRLERVIARAAAKGDLRTVLRANQQLCELLGLASPARLELSGPDGTPLEVSVEALAARFDALIEAKAERLTDRGRRSCLNWDHSVPRSPRSTASRRCPRGSAARPAPASPPQSAPRRSTPGGSGRGPTSCHPRRAGGSGCCAAAAARARRAPAPSGCAASPRPAAAGASPSWGAPGPTCVTSWSAASRASSRSARPGSTPTTR